MNRKRAVMLAIVIFGIVLASFLVSAQSPVEDLKLLMKGIGDILTSFFEAILGPGPSGTVGGEATSYLFARVLFLLVVFVVIWAVLEKIPLFSTSSWIVFILSLAVSLLATRFLLQPKWIETILLPYSVFGIALTAFIPLLIYAYFVESAVNTSTLRKIAWILAFIVFVGLWFSRRTELKDAVWVYPVAAIACLAFLTFDRTIQKAWSKVRTGKILSATNYSLYGKYVDEIDDLTKAQHKFAYNSKDWKSIERQIEDKKKKAEDILRKAKS